MVLSVLLLTILVAGGGAALWASQASRVRRMSLQRIGMQTEDRTDIAAVFLPEQAEILAYPPRYAWASPLAGALAACFVYFFTSLPAAYMFGFAVLTGAIAYLAERHIADSRISKIEAQLADAIDLMVASLRAGSALLAALEATVDESPEPLGRELQIMAGRIRVGENPKVAVSELAVRVPLESFRLFAHTLMVHWETGGSLATSLRTVGRTVRDRLEVSRRINAQAVEAQISVVAVMGITYGLTALMLNTNPAPILKLLYSQTGSYVAAAMMTLQAIGMVWIWQMSRIRF